MQKRLRIPFLAVLTLPLLLSAQGLKWDPDAFGDRQRIQPTRDILPNKASLKQYAPLTHEQHGSTCVAYSLASARTILHAKRNGWTDKNTITVNSFSPWFIYWRNRNPDDVDCSQGLDADRAVEDLLNAGVQHLVKVEYGEYYPFTDRVLTNHYPPEYAVDVAEARAYALKEAYRLETLDEIRFSLAIGMPVMIGMYPPDSFMEAWQVDTWAPREGEAPVLENGHAMVVVGYDDGKLGGGALEILNSWGPDWGDGGYIWVGYEDVLAFTAGAYALADGDPLTLQKQMPAREVSAEAAVKDAPGWRAAADLPFKSGSPAGVITQFKGLDPELLID